MMTTQTVSAAGPDATEKLEIGQNDKSTRDAGGPPPLNFHPEVERLRTPFMDEFCQKIYEKGWELAGDDFEFAHVCFSSFHFEDDVAPCLMIFLDADVSLDRLSGMDRVLAEYDWYHIRPSLSPDELEELQKGIAYGVARMPRAYTDETS